jgi:hypothetical protein
MSEGRDPASARAPRDPEELEARTEGPAPDISPLTTLGAVHLTVSDLSRSVRYYESAVGLETLERADGNATLGVAARQLLILVEIPGARPAAGYNRPLPFRPAGSQTGRPRQVARARRP